MTRTERGERESVGEIVEELEKLKGQPWETVNMNGAIDDAIRIVRRVSRRRARRKQRRGKG